VSQEECQIQPMNSSNNRYVRMAQRSVLEAWTPDHVKRATLQLRSPVHGELLFGHSCVRRNDAKAECLSL